MERRKKIKKESEGKKNRKKNKASQLVSQLINYQKTKSTRKKEGRKERMKMNDTNSVKSIMCTKVHCLKISLNTGCSVSSGIINLLLR